MNNISEDTPSAGYPDSVPACDSAVSSNKRCPDSADSMTVSAASGCPDSASASGNAVSVSDGRGMSLTVRGSLLTVRMKGNATTGYTWSYKISDPSVLTCESGDYSENAHPRGMVGVPGVQRYKFKSVSAGTASLIFTYARSWENGNPADEKTVRVTVDASGNILADILSDQA